MLNLQNLEEKKKKLEACDTASFDNAEKSFKFFLNRLNIKAFRHIADLDLTFRHPVTVIAGNNKIGKTSILLIIACSHENFKKIDSTKPNTELRNHKWSDVLTFTGYETAVRDYHYEMEWRTGTRQHQGDGKRLVSSKSWSGLGKSSSDPTRMNARIREREVRLIDLDRVLPVRSFSGSLLRKVSAGTKEALSDEVAQAYAYVLDIPEEVTISEIGSHINKKAYLVEYGSDPFSSSNAASGDESLIGILREIIETPNDSLILIDEIEACFHPSVQRKLADVIQYIAWRDKKQFILTTHSPTFLSSLPQKSRIFIERNSAGLFKVISNISVNAVFSKMDSRAYPLVQLYCEDREAEFIIRQILVDLSSRHLHFDRLINIIRSGPINQVKDDYERHKRNYPQMRLKIGYACVFDGDYLRDSNYSSYHENAAEYSMFLYPYTAPEKFLVRAYLDANENRSLQSALNNSDHHTLFNEMVNLGLAADASDARNKCWESFKGTPEYRQLKTLLEQFLKRITSEFSRRAD